MFTFQILDGGETFFFPLGASALLVGSGEQAQVRLREQGVEAEHARIEPCVGAAERDAAERGSSETVGYEIIALAGPVLVNGMPVPRARLNLGDRIEIGKAVLVLGTRVRRAATPKDVVEQELARPASRRGKPRSWAGLAIAAFGVLLAAGLGVFAFSQPRPSIAPPVVGELHHLRKSGDFAAARQRIADLRTGAYADDPLLLVEADSLEATAKAFAELRAKAIEEAGRLTRADQMVALRELRAKGKTEPQREAAGIVLGLLLELRDEAARLALGADPRPDQRPGSGANSQNGHEAGAPERGVRQVVQQGVQQGDPGKRPGALVPTSEGDAKTVSDLLADVERFTGQGNYAQALESLMLGLSALPADRAAPLRARLERVREQTKSAMQSLLADARAMTFKGDTKRALTLLRERAWQFPNQGELANVAQEIDVLERELEARSALAAAPRTAGAASRGADVGAITDGDARRRTLETLKEQLLEAGDAERKGDVWLARRLLEEAATKVRSSDLAFAVELDSRALGCALLGELYGLTFRPEKGTEKDHPITVTVDGSPATILGSKADRLVVQTSTGEREVRWADLSPTEWRGLLQAANAPGRAWAACALLAFRATALEIAEGLLVRAWELDASSHGVIASILQRERLDPFDPSGYELVNGKFVTKRMLLAEKKAKKLEERVARAVQSLDAKQKERALEELLAEGPDTLDALILALKNQQARLVDKIDKSEFKKSWEKLGAEREALDKARKHALSLIFDEAKYFYPYQPPAVDGKRAAEYWPIQKEVDVRVAKLREAWSASKLRLTVPTSVLEDTRRFQWVRRVLQELGETDAVHDLKVAWVAALPSDGKLDLQTFCKSERDREDQELYARVELFNKKLEKELSNEERAELRLTNEYRRMFGLRPVALHLKVLVAAREHSTEMATLGYFSHFSPTEGKKTPFDRMRQAGYMHGASENIAMVDGAEAAHQAWLHSSGHHRNILTPTHTEFAVGCSGRYWTQNFGRSKEYLENPAFPPAKDESNVNSGKK